MSYYQFWLSHGSAHIPSAHPQFDAGGRIIPLGPDGCLLPLDPSGRLFPHMIFPSQNGRLAVPIHLGTDGVLRLPNLEPIPVGNGFDPPINVDGMYMSVDSNSRPLYFYPELPGEPPRPRSSPPLPQESCEMYQTPLSLPKSPENIDKPARQVRTTDALITVTIDTTEPNCRDEKNSKQNSHDGPLLPREIDVGLTHDVLSDETRKEFIDNYTKRHETLREHFKELDEVRNSLGVPSSKSGVKKSTPSKMGSRKSTEPPVEDLRDKIMTLKKATSRVRDKADDTKNLSENEEQATKKKKYEDIIMSRIQHCLHQMGDKFKPATSGRLRFILEDSDPPQRNTSPLLRYSSKFLNDKEQRSSVNFSFLRVETSRKNDPKPKTVELGTKRLRNESEELKPQVSQDAYYQIQLKLTKTVDELKKTQDRVKRRDEDIKKLKDHILKMSEGFPDFTEKELIISQQTSKIVNLKKKLLYLENKINRPKDTKTVQTEFDDSNDQRLKKIKLFKSKETQVPPWGAKRTLWTRCRATQTYLKRDFKVEPPLDPIYENVRI